MEDGVPDCWYWCEECGGDGNMALPQWVEGLNPGHAAEFFAHTRLLPDWFLDDPALSVDIYVRVASYDGSQTVFGFNFVHVIDVEQFECRVEREAQESDQ